MTTKERGDIAVGFAISYYMGHQYEVCLPIGDKRHYDLIAEKDGKLYRVQVKFAGPWKEGGQCIANLRTMGGNQSFYSAKKYNQDAFDFLFIHSKKGEDYVIPWKEVYPKSSLSIEHGKYDKYKI